MGLLRAFCASFRALQSDFMWLSSTWRFMTSDAFLESHIVPPLRGFNLVRDVLFRPCSLAFFLGYVWSLCQFEKQVIYSKHGSRSTSYAITSLEEESWAAPVPITLS